MTPLENGCSQYDGHMCAEKYRLANLSPWELQGLKESEKMNSLQYSISNCGF